MPITTDLEKVRFLLGDQDATNYAFTDDDINYALTEEGNVKAAAALCLESAASSDARILRITTVMGLKVDAVQGARLLLQRADRLRSQAIDKDPDDGTIESGVRIAENPKGDRDRQRVYQRQSGIGSL